MENDIYELAAALCNLDCDTDDVIIEQSIYEKYGIDMENFVKVVKDLLEFTPAVISELTNNVYHSFGTYTDNLFCSIVKKQIK